MNKGCREWGVMQEHVRRETSTADLVEGFAVRGHGTGYLITYSAVVHGERQARAAFAHLDGLLWDRPCSFPDPGAGS